MRIYVNDGDTGGATGAQHVNDGLTVAGYFKHYKPGKDMANYRVRVNEGPASAGTCLNDGDRLTIGPGKLAGAAKCRS